MVHRNWFIGGVIIGIIISYYFPRVTKLPIITPAAFFSSLQPQAGKPVKLIIPALRVSAPVEQVGQDTDGRMSVPKNVYGTGWYEYGAKPGDKGNAVIDGHVNTPQLLPSVFANLRTLKAGDMIQVEDDKNRTRAFRVYDVRDIPSLHFPVGQIFGPSSDANLILITCDGVYQKNTNDYTFRTVVFSRLLN